jgi:hypothetical protein
MNKELSTIKFIYKKILKVYPFLTKIERNIFEKKSGSILDKFTKNNMTAEESILKLLSLLKNGHADIKEYHKPDRKFMRKVKPQRVPSFEFRNRILYIKIPSWLVWLGDIDKTLNRFCQKNINKYDAIIIDTRENQGGHSGIAHNFAGIFFKKPAPYGKFIKRGSRGKLITFTDKLEPNGKIFIDKLIVILISEKCFSSNELFLAPFKVSKRAVLVGKTTRGGSAHPISEIIKLSGKEFIVRIPTWRFFLKGKKRPIEKTRIRPDIYYKGRDIEKFAEKYLLKKLVSQNKKLAEEILKMAKEDQDARFGSMKARDRKKAGLEIIAIDKRNTQRAKEIIKKYGWPGLDLVGEKAGHMFWLIVQHADLNPKFQKESLKFLKQAVKNKQALSSDEALLTDRVLVCEGKKQIYGTQFHRDKDMKLVPRPIEDMKNLDKRRESAGLEPFEKYQKKMEEMGRKTKNMVLKKPFS